MLRYFLAKIKSPSFSSLSQIDSAIRSNIVKKNSIQYNFHLTLHKGSQYDGLTNITFQTINIDKNKELRIDFQGKHVKRILINSQQISLNNLQGCIMIPQKYLKESSWNNIAIQYSNQYDKDGNGCVSFIDVDQKQYLYTQFQPYFANRVFPLFDQPDLKGPMTLTISCPNDWEAVLSNQFETKEIKNKFNISSIAKGVIDKYSSNWVKFMNTYEQSIPSDFKTTSFNQTQLLPSYLYCFVVGPYKQLIINKNKKSSVPMKLYSIESLYPQMEKLAPYVEQVTVESMIFFQKYFGYKYPFSKYDQVFAHQYKWGAMQNAGIVTLNDLYLFKDKVSTQRLLGFGNTVVHELAHHWFGNLVTMKWWDDLWLNESFAEYISHYCLENIKGSLKTISYQSAMLSFFNRKAWGYAEDKLITTHPIRSDVENTFTAQSIFDGITYSKGAATMKQLMFLIGQESFSKALASYFKKYQFSNAVLNDLLAEMNPYFQRLNLGYSLDQWRKMWLETAGTNVLSCQWAPNSSKLKIIQGFDSHCSTLRLHRIKIALIQQDHSFIIQQALIFPQKVTQVSLNIPKNTVGILLNYDDLAFATVDLDEKTRTYFSNHLAKVQDSLSRALVWKSFYNMLIDSKITSKEFIDFIIKNIANQKSDSIFQEQYSHLIHALQLYTPKKYRSQLYSKIFTHTKSNLLSTPKQLGNRVIILKEKLIDFAYTQQNQKEILEWYYNKNQSLSDSDLNNTLRWKIVLKIFGGKQWSKQTKQSLLQDMIKKDSSDTMLNRKLTCEALSASSAQFLQIHEKLLKQDNKLSITNTVSLMKGLNHQIHEQEIKKALYPVYFQLAKRCLLEEVGESQMWFIKGDYLENYIVHMDPALEGTVEQITRKIDDFKGLKVKNNDKIRRTILKKIDLLERRKRIYQYYEQKLGKQQKSK